tara:strand:- start:398 stop:589 length:192 start_codon:yes stop_codon:yes gene_type:complete
MTFDQAVELVQGWPKNRTVPRKLKAGIEAATGLDKVFMEQLVEALMVASTTEADLELIEKHFD